MAKLENWYIDQYDCIKGKVYGDSRFNDGDEISTSRVAYLDLINGKAITRNTNYELGTPAYLTKGEADVKGT